MVLGAVTGANGLHIAREIKGQTTNVPGSPALSSNVWYGAPGTLSGPAGDLRNGWPVALKGSLGHPLAPVPFSKTNLRNNDGTSIDAFRRAWQASLWCGPPGCFLYRLQSPYVGGESMPTTSA
jgi:hypothetical protein